MTKRENREAETFCDPRHDRVKLSAPPPPILKSGNLLRPPSIWLKLQATV